MFNSISLYKKIDSSLMNNLNVSDANLNLTYSEQEESLTIQLEQFQEQYIYINEHDEKWNPITDNLTISISFNIQNPNILFGINGVTAKENKLGIASKVYSRQSNYQEIKHHQVITADKSETNVNISLEYQKGHFKDSFDLEIFFYIYEVNVKTPGKADQLGMTVSQSPLYSLIFSVDGDGSVFPITEFSDKKAGLWRFERNWTSADEDVFDSSNVRLAMNTAHPLFEQIKNGKTRASVQLMDDIIAQFITLVIQQVILIENFSIEEADTAAENSILRMVDYWVKTYNIDISTLYSITNTVNNNLHNDGHGGDA